MIAVIFEVRLRDGAGAEYLDIAAELRPELEKVPGFISVERFQSLGEERKLLSLSFWESEDAINAWREHARHQLAQASGRAGIFENYRLRVAEVKRDYGMHERAPAPNHNRRRPG